MARAHARGRLGAVDVGEAARYYRAAARGGNSDAMLELGRLLTHGSQRRPEEARQWLEHAARRGRPEARELLHELGLTPEQR